MTSATECDVFDPRAYVGAVKVHSPDGRTWRVTRRWVPWRPRLREPDPLAGVDAGPVGDDLLVGIVLAVVLTLVMPILLVVGVMAVEVLLAFALVPLAVLGRVLLGRQWYVEVRLDWRVWTEERAGDWQESGLRIHALAQEIERGEVPEPTVRPEA